MRMFSRRKSTCALWPVFLALNLFIEPASATNFACSRHLTESAMMGHGASALVDRYLEPTQALLQLISERYPMASHEYVFVGRSPTLLAALVEVHKEIFPNLSGWILPLSLKNESEVSLGLLTVRFENLFRLFRPRTATSEKTLVFIDTVAGGRTFAALDRLLTATGRRGVFVGFSNATLDAHETLERMNLTHPFTIVPTPESYNLNVGQFKVYAPYASQAIEERDYHIVHKQPPQVLPPYKALIAAVRDKLGF